ncbi:MAG TPA: hypothetical protein GXX36_07405 [Clostridiaceae bacterium]|nr:hypothetical protein [Clostridiaceae bacterium]
MEESMDLREIIGILKQNILIILAVMVWAAILGAVISIYIIDPVYEASATMIVNKSNTEERKDITYNDILMTQKLVKTYSVIMQSNTVLDRVIDALGLEMGAKELRSMLTITGVNDTEVIKITVTSKDPEFAAKVANEILSQAPAEIIRAVKAGSVEIIDEATIPSDPVKPDVKMYTFIAGILGLFASTFVIFLKYHFDDTVKTEDDIAEKLKLPVLGVLPFYRPEPVTAGRKGRG